MSTANTAGPAEYLVQSEGGPSAPPGGFPGALVRLRGLGQFIAIGSVILIGLLPLLVKFFEDLWSRPQYQFFPVAILAAGYIGWERLRDGPRNPIKRGSLWIVVPVLVLALAALSGGLLYYRLMAAVSAVLALTAAIWWVGGWPLFRTLLPAGILLLVIIPPPAHLDDQVGTRLRLWAVRASSQILELARLPHLVSGTVIEIPGRRLLVEEACSGINSLMSVIAFSLLYGFWQRRRPQVVALLTLGAVGFVMCANIVRITSGAILVHFWQIDILGGSAHEMLGILLFAVSLGLVISFDRFLTLVTSRWHRSSKTPVTQEDGRAPVLRWMAEGDARRSWPDLLIWWAAAAAFLALGIALQIRLGHDWATSRLNDDASFVLPANLAGWERVQGEGTLNGRPETDGRKSNFWIYHSGNLTAGVALDYPFSGYHDATICYATAGWNVAGTAGLQPANVRQEPFYEAAMSKAPMMRGQLLFAQIDEHGHSPAPDPPLPPRMSGFEFSKLLSRQKAEALPTYQVQTLTIGFASLSAQQQAEVRALFLAARQELSGQLVEQLEGKR